MSEMRNVVVNVDARPPKASWVWKFIGCSLGLIACLLLLAIEAHLASLVHIQGLIAIEDALAPAPAPRKPGAYGFPPGGGSGNRSLDVTLIDSQIIHEREGGAVVTMLGQGRDASEFRYVAVQSIDEAFVVVIDRVNGSVWQCLGEVTNTTVEGKLPLQCVSVYDGPVLAVKPKRKK